MNNKEHRERRQYERYPLREDVLIDGRTPAYSQNICEDGMFLSTLKPHKEGSLIQVTFSSRLTVRAEVSNSQPGIGMGIEFVDLDNDQRKTILQIIEQIKREASHDFTL
ncbi:MAG: PilZ domain-containing protein [Nitrospirota bacterium]